METLVKFMEMSNGKGSKPRPLNKKKFDSNYDKIFNKKNKGPKCLNKQKKKKTT